MSTARHLADVPPSLRTTATGTAAWARTVLLWWPLSLIAQLAAADGVSHGAGVALGVFLFAAVATLEIRRAAHQLISPLAAGTLLATAGAGIGGLLAVFLLTGVVAG